MPSKKVAPIAEELIETLHSKEEILDQLRLLFSRQLEALRSREPALVGEMATKTQERAARLEELRRTCVRQMRLLGRVLGVETDDLTLQDLVDALAQSDAEISTKLAEARTAVREQAEKVNERSETVNYALEFAAGLNHELLVAMQEACRSRDAETYTARGQSEAVTHDRSFVNTVG